MAVKDKAMRAAEGGDRSVQRKLACPLLHVQTEGAIGEHGSGLMFMMFGRNRRIVDFNSYRTRGHAGRFNPGSNDRAISVATIAAYEALRSSMPADAALQISDGDLGENILLDGPTAGANAEGGLRVGQRLEIGGCTLELTEANKPCYRFNSESWAAAAKAAFSSDAPEEKGEKWFKSPRCPLSVEHRPGVRGWLAKVVREGVVCVGDAAREVSAKEEVESASG